MRSRIATCRMVFGPEPAVPVLEMVADVNPAWAEAAARNLGFARWSADWREVVADPRVDVVDITAPNDVHREIALAALAAGKPVYCEKPLANSAAETKEMAEAAAAAGVPTLVGFNYLKNPAHPFARELIRAGELGDDHAVSRHLRSGPAERSRLPVHLAPRARGRGLRRARRHGLAHARVRPVPDRRHRRGVRHVPRPSSASGRSRRAAPARARAPAAGAARRAVENDDVAQFLLRFDATARSARSARAASAPGARWA